MSAPRPELLDGREPDTVLLLKRRLWCRLRRVPLHHREDAVQDAVVGILALVHSNPTPRTASYFLTVGVNAAKATHRRQARRGTSRCVALPEVHVDDRFPDPATAAMAEDQVYTLSELAALSSPARSADYLARVAAIKEILYKGVVE